MPISQGDFTSSWRSVARPYIAVALVAGCYAPTHNAGTRCESACPGELVCIDHVCREPGFVPGIDASIVTDAAANPDAPPIDGPPGDADADGHTDEIDNCPSRANSDQHDEDADQHGDVCDPCPHLAGTLADADGDQIGDACDPQPSVAKQVLRFFDPFTTDRGEWQHSDGVTRVGEQLRASGASAFTRLAMPTGALRIAAGGTIASVSSATPHSLSISFGFDSTGDAYHYCQFYDSSGSGGNVYIMKANVPTYTGLAAHPYSGAIPTGSWAMRIDESVAAQQILLLATLGGVAYSQLSAATNTASPSLTASDEVTIYSRNADYRFDYFWVIETLP